VLAEHVLDGADVVAADDLDKVGPGGLEVGLAEVVLGRARVVEREG